MAEAGGALNGVRAWISGGALVLSLCGLIWSAAGEVNRNQRQDVAIDELHAILERLDARRQAERDEFVTLRGRVDALERQELKR